jgi:hypothetical protein
VLALAAANFVGIILFAAVYAAAGVRWLSQSAFIVCVVVIFVLVTTLWVRTEARHRHLDPLRRLGRGVIGLILIMLGVPALVLLPLSKLDTLLPLEVGLNRVTAPTMAILLVSLALVVLVNLIGTSAIAVRAVAGRLARRPAAR